jgi:hypothetical protein
MIYCENFYKCHNIPPRTIIKKFNLLRLLKEWYNYLIFKISKYTICWNCIFCYDLKWEEKLYIYISNCLRNFIVFKCSLIGYSGKNVLRSPLLLINPLWPSEGPSVMDPLLLLHKYCLCLELLMTPGWLCIVMGAK